MAVTAYKSSGTQANVDRSSGTAWGSPANAAASDNTRAGASLSSGGGANSDWLRLTNFGFSTADIPSGSAILGIEYQDERSMGGGAGTITDLEFFLRITAGQVGDNDADTATTWPVQASEAYATHGGATSLFGRSWLDTEIVSTDFGLDLAVRLTGGVSRIAQVDHVQIRVYYTAAVSASITGVTAAATASAQVGAVVTGFPAFITGITAAATAAGIVGVVTAVRIVSITGVTAAATASTFVGTIGMAVTGVTARASAAGLVGSLLIRYRGSAVIRDRRANGSASNDRSAYGGSIRDG